MTYLELKDKVFKSSIHRDVCVADLDRITKQRDELADEVLVYKKVLALMQDVATKTQAKLKQSVETIVQSSIDTLFPGYTFKVNFVPKYGKVDAEFRICKGGVELDPLASSGGGAVDAISFSLRAGCLRLANQRPLLILDEPFKHLRGEPRHELGKVLSTLVNNFGIQVLMVSDVAGTDINADVEFSL